ncbi:hypothetical protein XF_1283 [Xylella fastidiosa 9a5c]|uniref:Uncharacterized protein n=1 Tax=Xylella fastidiosa (strain 9a5c) TaxID=160492 RepID=Q9PDU6_XYLFA|nr:hypothetical protein XF_1283 [Xylella fastidiosa 9a5c]
MVRNESSRGEQWGYQKLLEAMSSCWGWRAFGVGGLCVVRLYRDDREVFVVDDLVAVCYRSASVTRMFRSID